MLRLASGLAIVAVGATAVWAQNLDAIKQRREAMRAVAKSGSPPFKMFKGEQPFELALVQAGLKTYQEQGAKLIALFPEDSKTGGNTDASPTIWQQRQEFEGAINTFIETARVAAGVIKDEATFKAEYQKVMRTCGNCHKDADGFSPRLSDSFRKMREPL